MSTRHPAGKIGLRARMVRTVLNLLLAVVTLSAASYLAVSALGYERYVITGGSMSGSIERGSLVLERAVPVHELEVGDVITYLPPPDSGVQNLVTHRLTSIKAAPDGSTVLRTKGDANAAPDPWTFSLTAQTQPVVEVVVPKVGYAFIALADRETRMLVVGAPAGLVALLSLVDLLKALAPRRGSRPARRLPTSGLTTAGV